jgi:hypothetical protein
VGTLKTVAAGVAVLKQEVERRGLGINLTMPPFWLHRDHSALQWITLATRQR